LRIFCNQLFEAPSTLCKERQQNIFDRGKQLKPLQIKGEEKRRMNKIMQKLDMAIIGAKAKLMEKREGSDQLIVMFIIIAVAAGIAGLLYIFAKGTLLPNFQTKITNLIDGWFNHS
jgi:hypothetical protein